MTLEQALEMVPSIGARENHSSIDVYAVGLVKMYTGPIGGPIFGDPPIMDFGHIAPLNEPLFRTVRTEPVKPLTIIDLPASGVQIHIHEGPGGTAHLKTYDGSYVNMSSYSAAIADWLAKNADIKKTD